MGLEQWLIDRAAARRAADVAADPDAPLDVPGLVWTDPNRALGGWRPPEYIERPDPRDLWKREHAQALRAEVVSRIEQGLIVRARTALDASAAARAARR